MICENIRFFEFVGGGVSGGTRNTSISSIFSYNFVLGNNLVSTEF